MSRKVEKSTLRGPAFDKPLGALLSDAEIAEWAKGIVLKMDGPDDHLIKNLHTHELDVACFLVGSSITGPDEHRLACIFNIDLSKAIDWGKNLRRSGLWLQNDRHRALVPPGSRLPRFPF